MKKNIKKINYLFFLILPFIDLITGLVSRFIDLPISIGMIIKGLYILLIAIYILFYSKSNHKKKFIIYISLCVIFTLMYFITKTDLLNTKYLFNEISTLFKTFFASIIFFAFLVMVDDFKYEEKDINKLMIYSLITYVILLVVPTITNTNFNSYITKDNEGSIGWFYAANDISSIILMLYPFIYTYLNKKINNNNKKTYLYYLFLPLTIYSIFIIGTKTSWLGLILVSIITLISYILKKEKKNIILLSIVLISIMLLTLITPAFKNINKETNRQNRNTVTQKETIKNTNVTEEKDRLETLKEKCDTHKFSEIIDKRTYNLTNIILSGRQNKAYSTYLIYQSSKFSNKIFGIGFSNTDKINNCYARKYIEMDFLDILFHYGIIGLLLILTPFMYILKISLNNKNNIKNAISNILITLVIIFISSTAGHVIGYPTANLYLSIYLLLIYINLNKKTVKKNDRKN